MQPELGRLRAILEARRNINPALEESRHKTPTRLCTWSTRCRPNQSHTHGAILLLDDQETRSEEAVASDAAGGSYRSPRGDGTFPPSLGLHPADRRKISVSLQSAAGLRSIEST